MCLTQESQNKLWKRLDGIGFNIKSEEIFSSLTAAHDLVKSRNLRPFLLLSDSAMEVSIYSKVKSSSSYLLVDMYFI